MVEVLADGSAKYDALGALMRERCKDEPQKILIFCQKKVTVDELEAQLEADDGLGQDIHFSSQGIHGDKDQRTRHTVLRRFKEPLNSKKTRLMIATDVASRGLDVRDVSIVVNYDMPTNTEDYVHRIGRTGRAGAKGLAVGFITYEDRSIARGLINVLQRADQEVPSELYSIEATGRRKRRTMRDDDDGGFYGQGGGGGRGRYSKGSNQSYGGDQRSTRDDDYGGSKMANRRASKLNSRASGGYAY